MKVQAKPQLSRQWIDPHALGIVKALQKAGHPTYLVGGCVRDLLLGVMPKDFDIATSARPEEVNRIIHRSFIIGKRFRLVLIKRDQQQFEVATFRRDTPDTENEGELIVNDNLFGTPEEDARRRDFTVNGLFYDPLADQLIDHIEGVKDLENRLVRMIGDPDIRLREDPIRILRALRLAHMTGFQIESSLRQAMQAHANQLPLSVLPRRREEILKILRLENPALALQETADLGILKEILPVLNEVMQDEAAQEIFLNHLQSPLNTVVNKQNAVELFGVFIHAVVHALYQEGSTIPDKANEWLEHPKILPLMRDQLGMFKFEQSLVAKALHMQSTLQRVEEFARKGPRRQLAVLKNEAFSLAMLFAKKDLFIPAQYLMYWQQAWQEALPQLRAEKSPNRRRRRRRRPPRKQQTVADKVVSPDNSSNGTPGEF